MSVTVTAKPLINTKYASSSATAEYTVAASTKTIVDKFTVTNVTGSAATLTVQIIPSGESVGTQHTVIGSQSISANTTTDLSSLQNQVLTAGDIVRVAAGTASALVIRMSGREVVTA